MTLQKDGITVVSVNYKSAGYIRFNEWLLKATKSAQRQLNWLILNNTPGQTDAEELPQGDAIEVVNSSIFSEHSHDKINPAFSPRSTQHGLGLNELVPQIKTKYGLILDPDCFLLQRNWDTILINALEQTGASLIGAPYHPSRSYKYGLNFPMVTFMFFKTADFVPLNIDFRPGKYPDFDSVLFRNKLLRRFFYLQKWKDTGWRTMPAFRKNKLKAISFDAPFLRPKKEKGFREKVADFLLPERYHYLPQQLYQRPDNGLIDEKELYNVEGGEIYEEYYYQDKLMLCHLRAVSQRGLSVNSTEARFWLQKATDYLELSYPSFENNLSRHLTC